MCPWRPRRAVHNAGLIHGDFKTLNLLVGADQRVKVADFGLSKVLDVLSVLPGTKTITGTPQYMAPEVSGRARRSRPWRRPQRVDGWRAAPHLAGGQEPAPGDAGGRVQVLNIAGSSLFEFDSWAICRRCPLAGSGSAPFRLSRDNPFLQYAFIISDGIRPNSLAIVMWELLNGLIPWKGMDIVQIIQKVERSTARLCIISSRLLYSHIFRAQFIYLIQPLPFLQVTDKANDIKGQPPPGRPPIDPVLYQTAPPGYIQLMQICWAQVCAPVRVPPLSMRRVLSRSARGRA